MSKGLDDKDLTGEYYKDHITIIFDKLMNYGLHIKQLKELYKTMLKSFEMSVAAAESIQSMNTLISDNLRKNRPDSELADKIPISSTILKNYETERCNRWSHFLSAQYSSYEIFFEKKLKSIKNYLKNFESEDKDRLIAIKKLKPNKITKHDKNTEQRDEIADKYFDLRIAREDCLRKLMIDENILYTSLLELNTVLLKNDLFSTDSYTLQYIRPKIQEYDHILKDINSIPPECDYVIKNPSLFIDSNSAINIKSNENVYKRPKVKNILEYYKFKSLTPFLPHPKQAIFQYITIDNNNEIDLVNGDLIICYTDVLDGWQYGINISTERSGWFPASFTIDTDNADDIAHMSSFLEYIQIIIKG